MNRVIVPWPVENATGDLLEEAAHDRNRNVYFRWLEIHSVTVAHQRRAFWGLETK